MSENASVMVGDYRLEKTIGQGTYGKVKLGIHVKTNEKVIIFLEIIIIVEKKFFYFIHIDDIFFFFSNFFIFTILFIKRLL